jgi:hypothetical protein
MFMDRRVFVNAPTGSPKFPHRSLAAGATGDHAEFPLEALDALVKHDETNCRDARTEAAMGLVRRAHP